MRLCRIEHLTNGQTDGQVFLWTWLLFFPFIFFGTFTLSMDGGYTVCATRSSCYGPLRPLSSPPIPFHTITFDIVTVLPEEDGFDAFMSITCRFTKMTMLIPGRKNWKTPSKNGYSKAFSTTSASQRSCKWHQKAPSLACHSSGTKMAHSGLWTHQISGNDCASHGAWRKKFSSCTTTTWTMLACIDVTRPFRKDSTCINWPAVFVCTSNIVHHVSCCRQLGTNRNSSRRGQAPAPPM